jgi:hypothetical protein
MTLSAAARVGDRVVVIPPVLPNAAPRMLLRKPAFHLIGIKARGRVAADGDENLTNRRGMNAPSKAS